MPSPCREDWGDSLYEAHRSPRFHSKGKPMRIVEVELADGQVYPVHAEMIMYYSSYFRACLSNDWSEARSLKVKLTDPAWVPLFGFVVDWMTDGLSLESVKVDPPVEEYIDDELVYEDHYHPTVRECVDIWLLADYLGMPRLQNNMIDHLAISSELKWCAPRYVGFGFLGEASRKSTPRVPKHILGRVWENTLPDSKLRRFFVSIVCHPLVKKDPGFFGRLHPDINSDLLGHYDQRAFAVSQIVNERSEWNTVDQDREKLNRLDRLLGPIAALDFHVPDDTPEDRKAKKVQTAETDWPNEEPKEAEESTEGTNIVSEGANVAAEDLWEQ